MLENPDDWGSLQAYLDCRLPGSAAEASPPPAGAAVQRLSYSAATLNINGGQDGPDAEVQCWCVMVCKAVMSMGYCR